MIRVFIADDHAIVRQGLRQIVSDTSDLTIVGEAGDAQAVFDFLLHNDADVLVLDLSMPGRGGLDILRQVRSQHSDLPVLVLSMHPEEQYAVRSIRAGADGYLTKEAAANDLVTAIRTVAAHHKYVTPTVAEQMARFLSVDDSKLPHESLSDREFSVLRLIAKGRTVTEIAEIMSLSTKTISTYRARILEKMQLKTNAELIQYMHLNNLID